MIRRLVALTTLAALLTVFLPAPALAMMTLEKERQTGRQIWQKFSRHYKMIDDPVIGAKFVELEGMHDAETAGK